MKGQSLVLLSLQMKKFYGSIRGLIFFYLTHYNFYFREREVNSDPTFFDVIPHLIYYKHLLRCCLLSAFTSSERARKSNTYRNLNGYLIPSLWSLENSDFVSCKWTQNEHNWNLSLSQCNLKQYQYPGIASPPRVIFVEGKKCNLLCYYVCVLRGFDTR